MKIKKRILKSALISLLILVSTTNIFAENHSEEKSEKGTYNPVPKIMHHIKNSHEWHLFDYKDNEGKLHPVSIPLPVILYTSGNIDFFMSSDFNHGHSDVQKEDRIYSIDEHSQITVVNTEQKNEWRYGKFNFVVEGINIELLRDDAVCAATTYGNEQIIPVLRVKGENIITRIMVNV